MFLCTANSCRSQIAEGLARNLGKGLIEPYSAGLFAFHIHPRAIQVMNEIGIDISEQKSKALDKGLLKNMDMVITLCGHAEASCPATPPEIKRVHWPIEDPVGATGTEEEIMDAFRKTRNEIKTKIQNLFEKLKTEGL